MEPGAATKVTLATIYLHYSFRKSRSRNVYCSVGMLATEFSDSREVIPDLCSQDPLTNQQITCLQFQEEVVLRFRLRGICRIILSPRKGNCTSSAISDLTFTVRLII